MSDSSIQVAPIHVVAGVLGDDNGRILVAQRAQGKHLAGAWEFPGGKIEPGEDPRAALRRELHEELGIAAGPMEPLIAVHWRYPDKTILLDAYRLLDYAGVPSGRENQALLWCHIDEIAMLEMPPPDRPIVNALRLPDRYAITPEPGGDDATFLENIKRVLARGVQLLQLRTKTVEAARSRRLAFAARELTHAHGARLLLNDNVDLASACAADGVHLSSSALMSAQRRPLGFGKWVAASCHDEAEIRKANELGIDFGVLGPIAPTTSHADAAVLGWERFAELCALAAFPLFALGGLRAEDLSDARVNGGQGIAGISQFFGPG